MNKNRNRVLTLLLLALGATSVALAAPVNPPTKPQTSPAMNAKEKANLKLVLDFWREVIESGHVELASKYLPEDYIQHNPNIPSGRAAFVNFFQNVAGVKPKNPIAPTLQRPPVVTGAKGDFVFLVWEPEEKHPTEPNSTYYWNSLDIFRLENGKIQEHWDSATRMPLPPGAPKPASFEQPKSQAARGSTGTLSADEKKNLDLAKLELKDMIQYGHLELGEKVMDPDYIQHNPNIPQGRDALLGLLRSIPAIKPTEIKPEWIRPPSITLVSGPYVVFLFDRKGKDPWDSSKEYTWGRFDVLRIENNLVKEHWDEAKIGDMGPPPPKPAAPPAQR